MSKFGTVQKNIQYYSEKEGKQMKQYVTITKY